MSPRDSSDDPRGAYNLLVRQFRIALASCFGREKNALLHVKRIQLIRPTEASAAFAASELMVGNEVKVIDFDWSGKEGEVTYPCILNDAVGWHEGAKLGDLIKKEHDIFMIDQLCGENESPPVEASLGRLSLTLVEDQHRT